MVTLRLALTVLAAGLWAFAVQARDAPATARSMPTSTSTSTPTSAPIQPGTPKITVRDTMAQRMQACVPCHGPQGRATRAGYFPRIAGKPEGYLFNQLKGFQAGRRRNPAMQHLLQHLNDDYLRDIAVYFARLDLPHPAAQVQALSAAQRQRAEELAFRGLPERGIPACIACHGEHLAGQVPAVPGLPSLPADYVIAQLGAWRTGSRRATAPDCMADIARRLGDDDVGTVSRWLAAQALPAGTRPQAASSQPWPLPCGSAGP